MVFKAGNKCMTKIFVGSDGIRSGWRLLMFFVLLEVLKVGLINIVIRVPRLGTKYVALLQSTQFDPVGTLLTEVILVASLLIALTVMTAVEGRRISDYGWRAHLPKATRRWVIGFLFGAGIVTAMYTLQWLEHVYSFGTWALPPSRALVGGALWFVGCFLIGVFEEGVFRGYAQFTLEKSIGFWAAAFTISVAFGLVHLRDPNVPLPGVSGPLIFGLLFAFCLWRTGDLWLAMGIHSAVDFSEFFIFAPSHSPSSLHLLTAGLHGPAWLTGWIVGIGPESSVNGFAVLAVAFVVVWLATRAAGHQRTKWATERRCATGRSVGLRAKTRS